MSERIEFPFMVKSVVYVCRVHNVEVLAATVSADEQHTLYRSEAHPERWVARAWVQRRTGPTEFVWLHEDDAPPTLSGWCPRCRKEYTVAVDEMRRYVRQTAERDALERTIHLPRGK